MTWYGEWINFGCCRRLYFVAEVSKTQRYRRNPFALFKSWCGCDVCYEDAKKLTLSFKETEHSFIFCFLSKLILSCQCRNLMQQLLQNTTPLLSWLESRLESDLGKYFKEFKSERFLSMWNRSRVVGKRKNLVLILNPTPTKTVLNLAFNFSSCTLVRNLCGNEFLCPCACNRVETKSEITMPW